MKKILFLMGGFIGLIFSTSYSMDMCACVDAVKRRQEAGEYLHLTALQKQANVHLAKFNNSVGQEAEAALKELMEANDELWKAQLEEASKRYTATKLKMLSKFSKDQAFHPVTESQKQANIYLAKLKTFQAQQTKTAYEELTKAKDELWIARLEEALECCATVKLTMLSKLASDQVSLPAKKSEK